MLSRDPLTFTVPLRTRDGVPHFLGPKGTPVTEADAVKFTLRTPTVLDEHRISARVRQLAEQLHDDPDVPKSLAYAELTAAAERVGGIMRSRATAVIRDSAPASTPDLDSPEYARLVELMDVSAKGEATPEQTLELEQLTAGMSADVSEDDVDAFLQALPALLAEADVADALKRFKAHPALQEVRRLQVEAEYLDGILTSLDSSARWYVLSDKMAAEYRELDAIPGYSVYGNAIMHAWRTADRERQRFFLKPSAV